MVLDGRGLVRKYQRCTSCREPAERVQCVIFVWNHLTVDNIITCGYSALSSQHNEDFHYPNNFWENEIQVECSGADRSNRNSQVLFM